MDKISPIDLQSVFSDDVLIQQTVYDDSWVVFEITLFEYPVDLRSICEYINTIPYNSDFISFILNSPSRLKLVAPIEFCQPNTIG